MSDDFTIQEGDRYLRLRTPLGEDAMILTRLDGEEAVSDLFSFQFEMLSAHTEIAAKDIVGKRVTGILQRPRLETPRYFSGLVTRFGAGPMFSRTYRYYTCEIRPWLWFLTLSSDSRVFQDKTAIEIITSVFSDHGFADFDFGGVKTQPPVRKYCVQYRETDYDFVTRLMAEEGLYYYFEHEEQKNTMHIADSTGGYGETFDNAVPFRAQKTLVDIISRWEPVQSFISGKWTQRDYDFQKPSTDLTTTTTTIKTVPGMTNWEVYDYPSRYYDKARGDDLTRKRMELSERDFSLVEGDSFCPGFYAGAKFTLSEHEVPSEQGAYALTRVIHRARDYTQISGQADPPEYENTFLCIPSDVVYRPDRPTHKPVIAGPQTAVVVGPSGEEIYTDEYGRVKIQFHWDREGTKNEKSSCWVRVSQPWAGNRWGGIFIPRIGMEVIVDFFEGDADRPIITGYVYNAENAVPYSLPGNKTQSGIKTRSSMNGGPENYNELRFEDKKGDEQVYVHAEKNMDRVVENDDTLNVGNDQSLTIHRNRTETVETGDEYVEISQGDHRTHVKLGKSEHEAMTSIELRVGQTYIKLDQSSITLSSMRIMVEGTASVDVTAPMTTVNGDGTLTLTGGIVMIN
ncbi:type VI secretion system tip protein VgrG [Roseospira marina]|uniref:Type VI secretion system tip protein VgrG n=1 Tax=Roseospira marina TaxID=140057 RepID=A0A5M6IGM4_9PROT|nr:type VI secretion system tip protein VgrG [Roseospira marina]KAA5606909.1 type VI secretion system tip protein VgrG [Roseospira marina]MBB4312920.1 type VI secretion system secreted protein VgrG [Roseospira marina]MBB5086307.1 type VI secretion system secreted protein VgrG [Roseospira marina]